MTFSVDRIEGDTVVLLDEKGKAHNIPLGDIPFDISEGDILNAEISGGVLTVTGLNIGEKDALISEIRKKLNKFKSGGKEV